MESTGGGMGISQRVKNVMLLLWVILLPLTLATGFSLYLAQQQILRQQQADASLLIAQAESISDEAWDMIDRLRPLERQSCDEIETMLQRYSAQYAYFRSIGMTASDLVTCSSAFGNENGSLQQMILGPLPEVNRAWWSLSVAGTWGVPNRPAVLFIRRGTQGYGAYALVEAQYLLDVMRAIHDQRGNHLSLRVDNGYRIETDDDMPAEPSWLAPRVWQQSSARFPIHVTITVPGASVADAWRQNFFTFLPVTLILTLLLAALANVFIKRKRAFADELRRAIAREEFYVHYQPLYDARHRRCYGVEALLRWRRRDGSEMAPDSFITLAEREGCIVSLTHHLLRLIVRDSQRWQLPDGFHLSINIAAAHLQDAQFVDDIQHVASQLSRHRLTIVLELTERSLIGDDALATAHLRQLRQAGIRVAIDDFGTGHCALSYLQRFPLDYLKIDRGFVHAIEDKGGETPILEAIIHLGHTLELQVVAEGVETAAQFHWLCHHQVRFIQGYFYARPMGSQALMDWLGLHAEQPAPGH
ncbi:EAL domain-containing protein [Pantoea sp. 1.19]|uniref:EAL domain-containing protein n=1 Tax=Pantoea sp. 1.19 TaxID=1925589 RepID=UPI00147F3463|nr:EAL domain-containing protein [Pantoea sp. 1.19]